MGINIRLILELYFTGLSNWLIVDLVGIVLEIESSKLIWKLEAGR